MYSYPTPYQAPHLHTALCSYRLVRLRVSRALGKPCEVWVVAGEVAKAEETPV